MDIKKLKKLIELVESSGIDELEINEDGSSVKIIRRREQASTNFVTDTHRIAEPSTSSFVAEIPEPKQEAKPSIQEDGHTLKSPMVGVFYRAPSPTSPNFAEVGDKVNVGDPLCIIEAMKMMNQIKADKAGVIKAILVDNSQPVEYDQPLFIIS
jgi:acetyl-CoA carboxylase biotin carboxyl carrier protein